jgi:hypothetical protein
MATPPGTATTWVWTGDVVKIDGTLWDRWGPAVSFGDDALRFHTKVTVDCGVLADGYDGTWTRNYD